jgi:replicative DNA helicase
VVLDYIQIIPVDKPSDRVAQVGEAIVRSKELAIDIGAPIVFCVQAGRRVDDYGEKIPTAADCQWASAIEQTADKLIGIWRPVLTEGEDADPINVISTAGKREVKITQTLFIARLLKQRMAQAGQTFILNFAPQYVRLSDMELDQNYVDLNALQSGAQDND